MEWDHDLQIADYFETQTITKESGSYYKLRDWIGHVIKEEIQSAILAEREECAKICEKRAEEKRPHWNNWEYYIDAANRIRARSQTAQQNQIQITDNKGHSISLKAPNFIFDGFIITLPSENPKPGQVLAWVDPPDVPPDGNKVMEPSKMSSGITAKGFDPKIDLEPSEREI